MAPSKSPARRPNDGEKLRTDHKDNGALPADDTYTHLHLKDILKTLATVGTLMASLEASILTLTLSLARSKLRTVSMCFAVLGVINTSFTALYSMVTHILLKPGRHQLPKPRRRRLAKAMIGWCASFLVIGTCAGYIALILYFFASSSNAVSVFVVMIIFIMGVCPIIWVGLFRLSFMKTPDNAQGIPLLKANNSVDGVSLSSRSKPSNDEASILGTYDRLYVVLSTTRTTAGG
ncbi:hypothetical protein C8R45DRAFT_923169 [Mycena sanguinolenta]|nr:hypothetical protein C8R45DRAFT_923169 [Mycena sanguinolenta]